MHKESVRCTYSSVEWAITDAHWGQIEMLFSL
jgi:hypothetical protein